MESDAPFPAIPRFYFWVLWRHMWCRIAYEYARDSGRLDLYMD
jgi:hypothetical protein